MPLLSSLPEVLPLLPAWMARQRWYTGKGRIPVLRIAGGLRLEDPTGQVGIDIHLLVDESGQTPTTYQVPLTCRSTRLAGGDAALVARMELTGPGDGDTRYIYDAPHDPAYASALLRLMLEEGTATSIKAPGPDSAPDCGADGHRLTTTDPGELHASRVLTGEQSNTSIIIDLVDTLGDPAEPLICKVFRVLQPGQNPDVVVQSALSTAGSDLVPGSVGYVCGQWPEGAADGTLATGHLAYAQEFLPGVQDAWRVALAALASGTDFSTEARSLGQATADVHATLAQAMGTREATQDDVSALKRSMRSRHAAAVSEVPAIAVHDKLVRASIDAVTSARWPALQRIHGDYHLGQVLNAPGRGWVLVDFEGEPLRPLAERNELDLALRDVAGMLRSFDYVAGSWEQEHPGRSGAGWAAAARTAFLEGYAAGAGRDPRQDAILLNALELDKALYEVVYEARNRPTWLGIPTTAIARIVRLSEGPRSELRP
jgi:predicted trehalose synthase